MGGNEPHGERQGQPLPLGDFIAAQRRAAELSLRQLAERAGISNPYVSQIERGLRKPSAEVLQQLANALQVSAETLYVKAGLVDPDEHHPSPVVRAVLNDHGLSDAQKQALIEVYTAFTSGAASPQPETVPSTQRPDTPATTQE